MSSSSLKNKLEPFVCGAAASCTAEIFTFPIDLAKTRLQIQTNNNLKYRGMIHCITLTVRNEGPAALYNGVKPALLRQATYGFLKLGFYQYLKRLTHSDTHPSLYKNILCGVIAGGVANSISNPTDVLKVRMQARLHADNKLGMFASFYDIYRNEGFKGLYRGVFANAQRGAILTAAELGTYDTVKRNLMSKLGLHDTTSTHFLASATAGFVGSLAANPIEVVRTRVMNQKKLKQASTDNSVYNNAFDCLIKTFRNEGPMAFYKGFIPALVRLTPWNVIFFMSYEKLRLLYNPKKGKML